ncbi:TPA: hypothetical protein ACH3X2_006602 [Trebouxia sp. C0005]
MQAVATNAEAGGLREAVHSNDLATLERMLATRTHDTGQQWTDEKSAALRLAASIRDIAMVEVLLHAGADVNGANPKGMTALHYAARIGHASLVDLLFKHGCEVAARTDQGLTALDFAMQQGHVSAVAALQAQLHRQEDVKAFHQAAKEGNATVVKELLTKGMLADVKATDGFTALHLAAIGGHLKVVQLLVAYGADATAQTQEGMTALHLAAKGGKITVAEYLLTQSLLLDMQNNQGCTALEWAMKGNQPACVTALQAWSESQKVLSKLV